MKIKIRGTAAAVVIFLRQNPKLDNKDLAAILSLGIRRIQKIRKLLSEQEDA